MKFKILDLFCGAGGFSCGLDMLENFQTVIGLDFDKNAANTFFKNFPDAISICGDITDNKTKRMVIDKARELGVNMIIGGPPCQGFSLKGKNLGLDDPRNFLFLEYVKIVRSVKPEVFVIENVKNLLNSSDHYFINQIVKSFKELGYIINYNVLNAKDFGVPQNRERAIIIGSLSRSINLPKINDQLKLVTVRDAISDLSYLNSGEGEFESNYINDFESDYQLLLRNPSGKIYNHCATNHSEIALKKLRMIPPEGDKTNLPKEYIGKQKFLTTWARLKWDMQSPTIDTRFDTPSNGRNSHPYLDRAITPREAARIQSFPDSFIFYGNKCSICKQIGNAVPPLLAKAIGKSIDDSYKDKRIKNTNFTIYQTDAYLLIKEFISKNIKVNHIITDPPYNISKENNFNTMNIQRKGVDFGTWDNNFDLFSWIGEYAKILDRNGSMIVFCSYLFISHIVDKMNQVGLEVKDIIEWKKSNPMPRNINRRYVQDKEFAVWAVKKGAKWIFNKPDNVPYLRSTFETSVVSGNERTCHPTQKSLKLMEKLIKIHTNEDDIILDPFMGSGTTGVASLNLNRKFIGIEVNPKYFEISYQRLLNFNNKN